MKKQGVLLVILMFLCFALAAIALGMGASKTRMNPLTQVANVTASYGAEQLFAQFTAMAAATQIPPTEFGPTPDRSLTSCGEAPLGTWTTTLKTGEKFQYVDLVWTYWGGGYLGLTSQKAPANGLSEFGPWLLSAGVQYPSVFKGLCFAYDEAKDEVTVQVRPPISTPTPGPSPTP